MKIQQITPTQPQKITFAKRVKSMLVSGKNRLKTLVRDVFERTPDEDKYFVLNGKKIRDKGFLGGPRELPNCVSGPHDYQGITIKRAKFSDEDIKKMKSMNIDERISYKKKLIEEGKYIDVDYYVN